MAEIRFKPCVNCGCVAFMSIGAECFAVLLQPDVCKLREPYLVGILRSFFGKAEIQFLQYYKILENVSKNVVKKIAFDKISNNLFMG